VPRLTKKDAPAAEAPKPKRTRRKKVTHEQIAERAYHLALAGGPDPIENWLRAERELVAV
jgi:DUF2934 family protein